ncbi:MAG: conjugal transfer protein TraN [Gammaproteobacteria bacterium]
MFIMLSSISFWAVADNMDNAYSQGEAFANNTQSITVHDATNPSYYNIPNYQGTNVPQASYSGDLTQQARSNIAHDKTPIINSLQASTTNQPTQTEQQQIKDIANSANTIQSQASTSVGSNVYCANDSCADTTYKPESQQTFGQNASAISALFDAGKEFNEGTTPYMAEGRFGNYLLSKVRTFKGENLKCRDMGFINDGLYDNCCSDSGWGQKIGLAGCNQEENTLWTDKGNDLCHYVGEYCSDKTLGICNEHKKSYCCFESILAKVIQEQGRTQLGWSFGKADSSDCAGFTPQQLQKIDFSKINFSEFYNSLQAELHIPASPEVQQELQRDMQQMFQNGNPT